MCRVFFFDEMRDRIAVVRSAGESKLAARARVRPFSLDILFFSFLHDDYFYHFLVIE